MAPPRCSVRAAWNRPGPYRGGESREIRSQTPEGAILPRGQADLRWTAGPPGSVYEVRVLTPEGREKLRQSALLHRPWEHSTGPRTAAGKTRVAANGKKTQKGPLSVREVRAALADVRELISQMREARRKLLP